MLRSLAVPGMLSSCSWEGLSPRLGIAAENFVYFASIRPNYRVSTWNCLIYYNHYVLSTAFWIVPVCLLSTVTQSVMLSVCAPILFRDFGAI